MVARHQQSSQAQEMFEKVENFLASELSQTEFCRQHGLAYWTFRYWLKKYQARQQIPLQPAETPTNFIPLHLRASEPLLQSPTCEIEYPCGVIVRLNGPPVTKNLSVNFTSFLVHDCPHLSLPQIKKGIFWIPFLRKNMYLQK